MVQRFSTVCEIWTYLFFQLISPRPTGQRNRIRFLSLSGAEYKNLWLNQHFSQCWQISCYAFKVRPRCHLRLVTITTLSWFSTLLRKNIHYFPLACLRNCMISGGCLCWCCFLIYVHVGRRFNFCFICVSSDKLLQTGSDVSCLSKPLARFSADVTLSFHVTDASFYTSTQTSEIVTDFNRYLRKEWKVILVDWKSAKLSQLDYTI